jgi:hypothetical protein
VEGAWSLRRLKVALFGRHGKWSGGMDPKRGRPVGRRGSPRWADASRLPVPNPITATSTTRRRSGNWLRRKNRWSRTRSTLKATLPIPHNGNMAGAHGFYLRVNVN